MKNYKHPGEVCQYTAPSGGVVSGVGYVIGTIFCVATVTAAVGQKFTALRRGVVLLPKVGTDVIAEGARVFWDNTNKRVTTTASTHMPIGSAEVAAGNGVATCWVDLDGVSYVAPA